MVVTSFVFTMLSLSYKMDVPKVSYTHVDWDLDTCATTSIRLFQKFSSSFFRKWHNTIENRALTARNPVGDSR